MYVWVEKYSTPVNYIWYLGNVGWVVGPMSSSLCYPYGMPYAKSDKYYSYPYDVPVGHWKESSNGIYSNSPNLYVDCTSGLSTGAIVGITIGCICGVILLIGLIVGLCVLAKAAKKPRRTATAAGSAHHYEPNMHTNMAYNPSAVSDGLAYPGVDGFTVAPPPYDNAAYQQPPPVYDNAITPSI
jgi:hypothetical protein